MKVILLRIQARHLFLSTLNSFSLVSSILCSKDFSHAKNLTVLIALSTSVWCVYRAIHEIRTGAQLFAGRVRSKVSGHGGTYSQVQTGVGDF